RLGAEFGLYLTPGTFHATAHGARDIADLGLHGSTEVAADGGEEEGHGAGPLAQEGWRIEFGRLSPEFDATVTITS
ncbi:MAG: hypothetical protein IOD03_02180, partial [Methylocystis sp.]|nr:hypothetical protein [Methylocystis sp.]